METFLAEHWAELGPMGVFLIILVLIFRYLATKDKSTKEERSEGREHQERVFDKITASNEKNSTMITGALTGLTEAVDRHNTNSQVNVEGCKTFREEIRSKVKGG